MCKSFSSRESKPLNLSNKIADLSLWCVQLSSRLEFKFPILNSQIFKFFNFKSRLNKICRFDMSKIYLNWAKKLKKLTIRKFGSLKIRKIDISKSESRIFESRKFKSRKFESQKFEIRKLENSKSYKIFNFFKFLIVSNVSIFQIFDFFEFLIIYFFEFHMMTQNHLIYAIK